MENSPTIAVGFVKELYHLSIHMGVEAKMIHLHTGIAPDQLEDLDGRVPLERFMKLWKVVTEATQEPALGLKIGEMVDPQNMGAIGLIFLNAPTLEILLQLIKRYIALVAESDSIEIRPDGKVVHYNYDIAPPYWSIQGIERSLSAGLTILRIFAGEGLLPQEVHFRHKAPDYVDVYKQVFQCPVLFEQDCNALILPKNQLAIKSKHHNPYLWQLLEKQTDKLLEGLEASNSFQKQVRLLIVENLPNGEVTLNWCAEQLHMSRRTLTRKLQQEEVTFQEMLDSTRKGIAIQCLQQPHYSVNDLAFMLGFSEPSSFSRAFKQWTGQPPAAYRQSQPHIN